MKNKIDRDRRTNLAKGISLDVSDDPKGSDDSRRPEVVSSDLEGCHPDDMKFREHLKKFFKEDK